jgi:Na+/H+-translocating membrane pyrophosphatase
VLTSSASESSTWPFERVAALAACVVGVSSLLYAIVFLGLVPSDQRSDDAAKFYASYLNDGATALQASWALLALAGLASTLVIVALHARLRVTDARWAGWAAGVGLVGALLSTVHGVQEMAQNAKLADLWDNGDAATRAALTVSNSLPSASDPRGLASFGFSGLFMLAAGALILRSADALPRRLGHVALAGGVLLLLLSAGSAFEIDLLVLIPGGLVSLVVGPLWWLWLGLHFWRASEPAADTVLRVEAARA